MGSVLPTYNEFQTGCATTQFPIIVLKTDYHVLWLATMTEDDLWEVVEEIRKGDSGNFEEEDFFQVGASSTVSFFRSYVSMGHLNFLNWPLLYFMEISKRKAEMSRQFSKKLKFQKSFRSKWKTSDVRVM